MVCETRDAVARKAPTLEVVMDLLSSGLLLGSDEGDGDATSSSAGSAANAVDVRLLRGREVEVHDRLHVLEVHATRHEIVLVARLFALVMAPLLLLLALGCRGAVRGSARR